MFDWLRKLRAPGAERKLLAWHTLGRPVWPMRDPAAFAREGYGRNAIAYRCVRLIAEAAASAPLKVTPQDHPLARLLARPNPEQTGIELMEAFYGHLQVSGNAYLEAAAVDEAAPSELYVLRPDRMSVVPGADGWPIGWEHRVGAVTRRFARDSVSGDAPVLHAGACMVSALEIRSTARVVRRRRRLRLAIRRSVLATVSATCFS